MQRLLPLLLLCLVGQLAQAQNNPKPTRPGSNFHPSMDTARHGDIRERLVQLAMQNPEFEIADRKVAVAGYDLKKVRTKILGNITAQVNYNEYVLQKNAVLNYFPKYNVGVSLPFDLFITRSRDINIAKENLGIAQAVKTQQSRAIRAQVLTSYEDYLMQKQILEFQIQVTQDVNSIYLQKEKDFSEGIITAEEYDAAYKAWTGELSKRAQSQRDYNVAKIQLEMLIGMRMEDVMK